jgi:hypothetical protein
MSSLRISELEPAGAIQPSMQVPTEMGTDTRRAALQDVADWVMAGNAGYAPLDNALFKRTLRDRLRDTLTVRDFGAVGDGRDDGPAIQRALDCARDGWCKAVGVPGEFWTRQPLVIDTGVRLVGGGPAASGIRALAGLTAHVLATRDYDALTNMRVRDDTASGNTLRLTTVTGIRPGHRLTIWRRNDTWFRRTVQSVNPATRTVTFFTAVDSCSRGDAVFSLENAGPEFTAIHGLFIEGARDVQRGLTNVLQPQGRGSAGNLVINGERAADWPDGIARAEFCHNARLRLASDSDNRAVQFTVACYAIRKDGTKLLRTETFAGPGAGEAACVYQPSRANEWVSIACDRPITGNVWAGIMDGPEAGHGVAMFGPGASLSGSIIQKCRGFGVVSQWGYYPEGWTSRFATQRGFMMGVETFLNDGGGFRLNGGYDCDYMGLVANQVEHVGLEIGRRGPNTKIILGHFSAAYENSQRFTRYSEGVYIEADTAKMRDVSVEGASGGQIVVLGNNVRIRDCVVFDPNSGPFAATERAIGVLLGDADLGWWPKLVQASVQTANTSGGMFYLAADGGQNKLEASGYDVFAEVRVSAASGVSSLQCTDVPGFAVGEPAWVRSTSGQVQPVTITAISAPVGDVRTYGFTPAVPFAVPVASILARGVLYQGTPAPDTELDLTGLGQSSIGYRRLVGGLSLFDTATGAELVVGWQPGTTDSFLFNRGSGALALGSGNVQGLRLTGTQAAFTLPAFGPTPPDGTNNTQLATTEYVVRAVSGSSSLSGQRQVADGGVAGGNARGAVATDWQGSRTAASQVASGATATIGGGRRNTAAGTDSTVAGGQGNTITGPGSWSPGGIQASDGGRPGRGVWSGGQFAAAGDMQSGEQLLRRQTTNAAPTRLTEDGQSPTTGNTLNLPDFGGVVGELTVIAKAAGSTAMASWRVNVTAVRGNGAASVILLEGAITGMLPTAFNGAGANWRLDIAADTVAGGIAVTGNGAAMPINWGARFKTIETFTGS